MPRVKIIKAEAFNSVQDPSSMITIDVSNPLEAIHEAVTEDHYCHDNHCDIGQARLAGFPLVAAGLLSGATDCAHVDAVCAALAFNRTLPGGVDPRVNVYGVSEWNEWQQYFEKYTIQCPKCEAFCFAEPYHHCDNCGSELY
jgi:hypothetical protein